MLKRDELISGCLSRAADDEPVFVLRGQDKLAPGLIRQWAAQAHALGMKQSKVGEALKLADQMEAWPQRRLPD